ncbi:uncharacterized protein KIAA1143 homolog [Panonychus citri]|uniref:uncharacterized protein KIAA1143 homolog n=1 Tax=Panonychus citri TaxID=50023 RepID=UPI002306F528|nr:uncharacterized protein KIAA1143 homolog [Panonychus citri]
MSRKNGIMFSKPDEPAFLKRIKAKIGYKEGPNLETKNEQLPQASEDDYADQDDEKPVIVIPKNSKVTEREAQEFIANQGEDGDKIKGDKETETHQSGERLIFKKPIKSTEDEKSTSEIQQNSKRNMKDSPSNRSKIAKLDDNRKKLNDNRLLSFGDDEDED